ncbi:Sll0314/Alr1548 family TPR repeat-containing protein, partial [Coleofasciculus sp.]
MNYWLPTPRRTVNALAGAAIMVVSFWVTPSLAGDPFRPSNPRNIGDKTEAAFESIFKQGDYKTAKDYLQQAEASEGTDPLIYAMLAAIAYTERELETLNTYATKTRTTAEQLITSDPLRGNLYTAVGHFLEGTYNFEKEGPVRALSKLQKVFQYIDAAKDIDGTDPELNLLTGHMDLMLAVNVPFADPADAINKLETHGYPKYLAYRGIAVAYRDLKKYNQAMDYVERALAMTPDNP